MNTALLILSGMAAGFAAALLPKKRRPTARRRLPQFRQQEEVSLEQELAPFVHFGS